MILSSMFIPLSATCISFFYTFCNHFHKFALFLLALLFSVLYRYCTHRAVSWTQHVGAVRIQIECLSLPYGVQHIIIFIKQFLYCAVHRIPISYQYNSRLCPHVNTHFLTIKFFAIWCKSSSHVSFWQPMMSFNFGQVRLSTSGSNDWSALRQSKTYTFGVQVQ